LLRLPGQESGAANHLARPEYCWERTALQMTFSDMNRMRQSAPVRVWGGAISDGGRYWDR